MIQYNNIKIKSPYLADERRAFHFKIHLQLHYNFNSRQILNSIVIYSVNAHTV